MRGAEVMEYFTSLQKVNYEGKDTKNEFAFKYYNPEEKIMGKPMKEHLKFAMSYWHTLTAGGNDPFGDPTLERAWDHLNPMEKAKARVYAGFEFMEKLGIEYFCFHDRDIAPEAVTLTEYQKNLDEIVDIIEAEMNRTGIKLLWGTSNMFSHPRFMHGAATSPYADVFAYAAAQTKKAIDITKRLHGAGYVFWGGREGYATLLNTDTKMELDNMARFFHMAVAYAKEIQFDGQFYIEPKPKEPTKHQYDFDVQTVISFLKTYELDKFFKLNIEANHATLATHTFQHELNMARIHGMLGSVDANQGDMLLGWDTDQFPTNVYDASLAMYEILKAGGLTTGGLNFDAKVRRESFTLEDIAYSYIAGMDTFAKGLRVAAKLLEDTVFDTVIEERYSSYTHGIGKAIVENKTDFNALSTYALAHDTVVVGSGKQERLERILSDYIVQ